ncbi:MAG: biotin--[acetyl-CoA-carboxylase] ligase [Holosporales bacterium]|jgi:BirA family biotin operon repressor/biotin-[acetyl-CoA-carboxylase] ligase|nr:biotin--[acetyl-CoA-carboxylase] ligase [Holosporales bacterium]
MSLKTKYFDEITSTQDIATSLLFSSHVDSDYAIMANSQTAGRGRLNNRIWISKKGNFHCSYIINIENVGVAEAKTGTLNYVVMDAVVNFLKGLITNSSGLCLKLPNDILVNEKKLAGVLIEISYPYAVIGIGINLTSSPIELSTNLKEAFNLIVNQDDLTKGLYMSIMTEINKCY